MKNTAKHPEVLWAALSSGFCLLALGCASEESAPSQSFTISSPDGAVAAEFVIGERLSYSVSWQERTLIYESPISMTLDDGTVVGHRSTVVDSSRRSVDEVITPVVPEKFSRIRDHYEELSVDLSGGWGLDVRAFQDGLKVAVTEADLRDYPASRSISCSATIFEDGVNANRSATDYRRLEHRTNSGERVRVRLAPGGGWAARFAR